MPLVFGVSTQAGEAFEDLAKKYSTAYCSNIRTA
jgi:hypothetical protein